MRLGYTSAHSRLQLDAALSCAALRGLHQLSQHFRFSLFSFSELVNWRRVVFTSGRLGAACATSHSSHFIYSFLQIYMSLIRLSPHRDARPRHISKYECARVCVCYYYTDVTIFIAGNASFDCCCCCCFCCQSFFGSPPWGRASHEGCNTPHQLAYAAFFATASTRPISRLSCDRCIDYYLRSIDPQSKIVCLALN